MASGSNARAPPESGATPNAFKNIHLSVLYEPPAAAGVATVEPLTVDIVMIYATNGSKGMSVFEFDKSNSGDKTGQGIGLRADHQQVNTVQGKAHQAAEEARNAPGGVNWLLDENMLRSRIPVSRILGCSLDLTTLNRDPKQNPQDVSLDTLAREATKTLRDYHASLGTRPTVFIGHGYGTLLIQKMFKQDEFKDFTAASILFATPISLETNQVNEWAISLYGPYSPVKHAFPHQQEISQASNSWAEFQNYTSNWNMLTLLFEQQRKKNEDSQAKDELEERKNRDEGNQATGAVEEKRRGGKTKQAMSIEEGERQAIPAETKSGKNEFRLGDEVCARHCALKDIARMSGPYDPNFQCVVDFLDRSIQTNQLLEASEKGDKTKMTQLAIHCTHLNYANRHGETALHVAATHHEQDIVEYLLSTGKVDPNQLNTSGSTALHVSVQALDKFTSAVVEKLLSYGADPTMLDADDRTPSDLVQRSIDDLSGTENLAMQTTEKREWLEETKRHLDNPPPVLAVSQMARLTKQIPSKSSAAFKACKKTTVVVREIFKSNQYIPYYTDIAGLLYKDGPPPRSDGPEENGSENELGEQEACGGGFDKYFNDRRKATVLRGESAICRWFHIPMNNMAWVHDLFATLDLQVWPWPQGYRDYSLPYSVSSYDNMQRPTVYLSFFQSQRVVYPQISTLKPLKDGNASCDQKVHAIMMPYISYETYARQQAVNKLVRHASLESQTEHRSHMSSSPFYHHYGQRGMSGSLEKWLLRLTGESQHYDYYSSVDRHYRRRRRSFEAAKENEIADSTREAIRGYLNFKHTSDYTCDLPLHPRRTLDQSYYYTLHDTSFRDKTQVASRWFRRSMRGTNSSTPTRSEVLRKYPRLFAPDEEEDEEGKEHNILMIDQLWLWVIEHQDPKKRDIVITSFPDRKGAKVSAADNIQKQILDYRGRRLCQNTRDFVSQILTTCCKTLDSNQAVRSVSFLQFFESSIAHVEELSAQQFQKFRLLSVILQDLDEKHPEYQNQRRILLNKLLDISHESQPLTEVKDILDEIKIIRTTLEEQLSIIFHNPLIELPEAEEIIQRTNHNFKRLQQRAQDAESSIQNLLDLKQKQANLWEARTSREGAEETARQGNTLLVFTVVTVIFLPLSFMAAFFAIDVDTFPKDNAGNTNWPLKQVSGLLFGISFAVAIPFALLAFYVQPVKRIWGRVHHFWFRILALIFLHQLSRLPKVGEHFEDVWFSVAYSAKRNKLDPDYERRVEQLMGDEIFMYLEMDEDLNYMFADRLRQFRSLGGLGTGIGNMSGF